MIPAIFYVVVAAAGLDISTLRHDGWIFDMGGSSESWYKFYSYFSTFIYILEPYKEDSKLMDNKDFSQTSFRALWVTMPTQFALYILNS